MAIAAVGWTARLRECLASGEETPRIAPGRAWDAFRDGHVASVRPRYRQRERAECCDAMKPRPAFERAHLYVLGGWAALWIGVIATWIIVEWPGGGFFEGPTFILVGAMAVFFGGMVLAAVGVVARLALVSRSSRMVFLIIGPLLVIAAWMGAIWMRSTLNQAMPAPGPPEWAPPGGYDSNVVLNTPWTLGDRWGSVTDHNQIVHTCARTYVWANIDAGAADWQLYAVDTILVDPEGRNEYGGRSESGCGVGEREGPWNHQIPEPGEFAPGWYSVCTAGCTQPFEMPIDTRSE
jgi:hypothetical protein